MNPVINDTVDVESYRMADVRDRVIQGDCLEVMAKLPAESVDLVFVDPPYYLQLPKRKLDTRPTADSGYNRDDIRTTERTWSAARDKSPGQIGFYLDLYKTLRRDAPLVVTPESVRRQMWVLAECRRQAPV